MRMLPAHMKALAVFMLVMSAAVFVPVPASDAGSLEYPYIYKSPRTLAMGGANVAIGGRFDSVFYNPAGLSLMQEGDWEVNLIGLSLGYSEDALDFAEDMSDAFDTDDLNGDGDTDDDQLIAVNEVLREYRGKNLHIDAADLSSVAYNSGRFALGVGGLAGAKVDAVPHQGFGSEGLLEVDAYAQWGAVVGLAAEPVENFHAGVSAKFLTREKIDHNFTAREINENEDDLGEYIKDDLAKSGSGVGFDAGLIRSFLQNSIIRPSVGLSVMDIGDTDLGEAGEIPMTVNLGVALTGNLIVFDSLTVGVDYVDITRNYDQDDDWGKRLRLGGELVLIDTSVLSAALRAGLYQGYASYGAELCFTLLTVSYTSYAEELGAYAGQDMDRRHVIALNLGW